jgi:Uma2 family endonuclease
VRVASPQRAIVRDAPSLHFRIRRGERMRMHRQEPLYYSADMVRDLIDEDNPSPRYETVHGELLVTPAPRPAHQRSALRLARRLADYLDRVPVGEVFVSPADISFHLPDVLVQPDVFVVPREDAIARAWSDVTRLLLVVEVLSPSTTRHDRFQKRRLYQEQGVPLYWIVDVDASTVEVWTPELRFPHVEHAELTWHPTDAAEPFVLPLAELFAGL